MNNTFSMPTKVLTLSHLRMLLWLSEPTLEKSLCAATARRMATPLTSASRREEEWKEGPLRNQNRHAEPRAIIIGLLPCQKLTTKFLLNSRMQMAERLQPT